MVHPATSTADKPLALLGKLFTGNEYLRAFLGGAWGNLIHDLLPGLAFSELGDFYVDV